MTRIVYRHGRRFEVETLNPSPAPPKRPKQLFILVPLDDHVAKAAKATGGQRMLVWMLILHRSWKEQTPTVVVTNDMVHKYGISPKVKVLALHQLEKAGLVVVEWQTRKNPIATVPEPLWARLAKPPRTQC